MRSTSAGSGEIEPFRIIPALGQVPENRSHPSTKQRCHVLHDCVERSNHANGAHQFPVESRTGPGQAGASASAVTVDVSSIAGPAYYRIVVESP